MRQSQDGIRLMWGHQAEPLLSLAASLEAEQVERREANYVPVYC